MPANLFPQDQKGEAKPPVTFKAVSLCEAGKVLYTLATEKMAGIFSFDTVNEQEARLFHSADLAVQDLSFNPEHHAFACALMQQDGSADIATILIEGICPRQITEGVPSTWHRDGFRTREKHWSTNLQALHAIAMAIPSTKVLSQLKN